MFCNSPYLTNAGNVKSIIKWGLVIPKWYKIGKPSPLSAHWNILNRSYGEGVNMFRSNGSLYGEGIYLGDNASTSFR